MPRDCMRSGLPQRFHVPRPNSLSSIKPIRWLRALVRAIVVAGATLTILFLLLVLAVRLVVVPRIGDFREDITTLIANNIGRSVSIGAINAGWDGWSPTLSLIDFKLMDR